jgi:putative transposase
MSRKTQVNKTQKTMGVQQVLLSPNKEVKALLEYLCQQSGKLYSGGLRPKLVDNQLRFSLGLTVRRWFGVYELFLPMPSNLDFSKVKEFTILPKNGAFYLEMSYEVEKEQHNLDIDQALSIDLGTADNLAACVDTLGNSFLIDSRAMKAMNQLWNKKVATRKEGKPEGYWEVVRRCNSQTQSPNARRC